MDSFKRLLSFLLVVASVASAASFTACSSGRPLKVTNIQLGRSLNADGSVGTFATTFAPNDTIYVSILTEGAGDATISVQWKFAGQVTGEPKRQVSYKDVAATEFHLQGGPNGLPTGDYTVEAFVNGQSVGVRQFKVDKR